MGFGGADGSIDGDIIVKILNASREETEVSFDPASRIKTERENAHHQPLTLPNQCIVTTIWYLWARAGSGYHISQTGITDKWFWESSLDSTFESNPMDVSSWVKSTAPAFDPSSKAVDGATVSKGVANDKVTYTITFNYELTAFEAADFRILDDRDTDITEG